MQDINATEQSSITLIYLYILYTYYNVVKMSRFVLIIKDCYVFYN